MPIYKGNTKIVKLYKGTTQIVKRYKGTNIIYSASRLPAEFQEVEYLESSGTQYIDSGYVPKLETKLQVKSSLNNTGTTHDGCLLGTRNSPQEQFLIWFNDNNNNINISPRIRKINNIVYANFNYDEKIVVIFDKNGAIINGTTYSITPPTSLTISHNLTIFALNDNGTIDSRYFTGKLYELKLWDNSVLIRNFVPCYRKADNVAGLYDLVNGVFYTNAGTGSFVVGPAVNP